MIGNDGAPADHRKWNERSNLGWAESELCVLQLSVVFSWHIIKDNGRHAGEGSAYKRWLERSGACFGFFGSMLRES